MRKLSSEKGLEYIFMTLATPNAADKLSEEIDRFNKALSSCFGEKGDNFNQGYVRKLEITYNKSRNDYNPHFHVLWRYLSIISKMKGYYIKQSEWLDMWRDVTGLDGINEDGTDEICSLDVRKVNGYRQEKAVSEIAKYSAKDFEITYSQDVFDTFYFAMKGRQLMTFNGVFKEYRKKYESGELDHYKKKDENDYFWFLTASWMQKDANYSVAVRELTDDEKKFFAERYDKEGDETG
nr:protein rep [Enterococcus faecium]